MMFDELIVSVTVTVTNFYFNKPKFIITVHLELLCRYYQL